MFNTKWLLLLCCSRETWVCENLCVPFVCRVVAAADISNFIQNNRILCSEWNDIIYWKSNQNIPFVPSPFYLKEFKQLTNTEWNAVFIFTKKVGNQY